RSRLPELEPWRFQGLQHYGTAESDVPGRILQPAEPSESRRLQQRARRARFQPSELDVRPRDAQERRPAQHPIELALFVLAWAQPTTRPLRNGGAAGSYLRLESIAVLTRRSFLAATGAA